MLAKEIPSFAIPLGWVYDIRWDSGKEKRDDGVSSRCENFKDIGSSFRREGGRFGATARIPQRQCTGKIVVTTVVRTAFHGATIVPLDGSKFSAVSTVVPERPRSSPTG